VSAALAVRKALDEDASLARLDVAVMPENGKLVLSGSVNSAQLKTTIEEKARRAASGKSIDSKITVESK
jgi:osmotically-inducible protein OsmY